MLCGQQSRKENERTKHSQEMSFHLFIRSDDRIYLYAAVLG
jgi:hypothetical protein